MPQHRRSFASKPRDPHSAFVALGTTVILDNVRMQIAKQPGLRTCKGKIVLVRRHLDGRHTLWYEKRAFGCFDKKGRPTQVLNKVA